MSSLSLTRLLKLLTVSSMPRSFRKESTQKEHALVARKIFHELALFIAIIHLPAKLIIATTKPWQHSYFQVFDPRGRFMFNFGRKGSQDGELMRPTGVAVGHDGNIIVADRDNHRIQVFSSEGRFMTKFGTKGDGDGQLNDPHGLALTPEGNIVVADFRNNRVQLFGQPA